MTGVKRTAVVSARGRQKKTASSPSAITSRPPKSLLQGEIHTRIGGKKHLEGKVSVWPSPVVSLDSRPGSCNTQEALPNL